jgi:hypothetical protein
MLLRFAKQNFLFFILMSFLFFTGELHAKCSKKKSYKYDLAAAMIFRDDAPYLKEWIEFHNMLGVQKFYLYNNLSSDDYLQVLNPYIASGLVTLVEWPYESDNVTEFDAIQCNSYRDAHKRALKDKVKWLAIIDSDEFIVPTKEDSILSVLSKYNDHGGVLIYWIVFGTSWVPKIPDDKLLIETLVMNSGPSTSMFKSIIRPDRTADCISPHYSIYKKKYAHTAISQDEIRINHYWPRDEYYLYTYKIPLREKWGTTRETTILWATAANNETPEGKVILRFVSALRQRMGFAPKD